jgi:hypothetical protein
MRIQHLTTEEVLASLRSGPAGLSTAEADRWRREFGTNQVESHRGESFLSFARLIEAFGVRLSNAMVTGESVPLVRDAVPCAQNNLLHRRNIILAGTTFVSGEVRAVVFAMGMRPEFGKIA